MQTKRLLALFLAAVLGVTSVNVLKMDVSAEEIVVWESADGASDSDEWVYEGDEVISDADGTEGDPAPVEPGPGDTDPNPDPAPVEPGPTDPDPNPDPAPVDPVPSPEPGPDENRVEGIILNVRDCELTVGESTTISAYVEPENATNKDLVWSVLEPEGDNLSDRAYIASGSASGNTLESVNMVRLHAVSDGDVRVRCALKSEPEFREECWVHINYTDLYYEDREDDDSKIEKGNLTIYGIGNRNYTGTPQTFEWIDVYYKGRHLEEKRDYTISYKNNKDAGKASVFLKPMGEFSGKQVEINFTIFPYDLGEYVENDEVVEGQHFECDEIFTAANGKVQKVLPVIYAWGDNGEKLKLTNKKEYTCKYTDEGKPGAYKEPGDWAIEISGAGKNFIGKWTLYEHILKEGDLKIMANANISVASSYKYEDVVSYEENEWGRYTVWNLPDIKVTDGTTELEKIQYDSFFEYPFHLGKTNVIVYGTGDPGEKNTNRYYGIKRITVNVTGTELTAKNVTLDGLKASYPFDKSRRPEPEFTLKVGGKDVPGDAYWVDFADDYKPGKAKVTIVGREEFGYKGKVTKNYTITPGDLSEFSFEVENQTLEDDNTLVYSKTEQPTLTSRILKGGAAPKIYNAFKMYEDHGVYLEEGVDYTIKYLNNKKVGDNASIQITGIGDFKGSTMTIPFKVIASDLGRLRYNVVIPDKPYNAKSKTAWMSVPTIYDDDGTKLKAGTDYEKPPVYNYHYEGSENGEIPKPGTVIRVDIKGKGDYAGPNGDDSWVVGFYKIVDKPQDISKANFKIKDQIYLRKRTPVTLDKDDFTTAIAADKKTQLVLGEDFVILSYSANTNKGKAKAVLKGIGKYGGSKTVTFKINAKSMN